MSSKDIKLGVSLYSYQEAIWRGDLDLEGALTAVKGCGGEGVEIFGETLIPSFPYVSQEFLYKWTYMLDNLQLEPVCYEHFADRRYWRDPSRFLSDDEVFDVTMQYLRSAKKLGCKFIRLSHDGHNGRWIMNSELSKTVVNAQIFARLLPYAADMGVRMALEVHGPGLLEDGGNDDFLEAMDRYGHEGGGLMLDFSGCFRDMIPMEITVMEKLGGKPEIIEYLRAMCRKAYTFDGNNHVDWDEVEDTIKSMGAGPIELGLLNGSPDSQGCMRSKLSTPPDVVEQYASQLIYCHGKMHFMKEDCTCDELDYYRIIRALARGGYRGYISTEYEGQRAVPNTMNEVEQVRRQHVLMRSVLKQLADEGI